MVQHLPPGVGIRDRNGYRQSRSRGNHARGGSACAARAVIVVGARLPSDRRDLFKQDHFTLEREEAPLPLGKRFALAGIVE